LASIQAITISQKWRQYRHRQTVKIKVREYRTAMKKINGQSRETDNIGSTRWRQRKQIHNTKVSKWY